MRLRLLLLPILIFTLAACTPPADEPGATIAVEETAEPTVTEVATAVATLQPTAASECEDLPEITTPGKDGVTVPENAVVVFQKSGGFAGITESTIIYADGRIENDKNESLQVDPQVVEGLVMTAVDSGFFEFDPNYVPENYCCDFFNYSLTIRDCDEAHTVLTADQVPGAPVELQQLISTVEAMIMNVSASVPPAGTVVLDELTPGTPSGDMQITRPAPGTPG